MYRQLKYILGTLTILLCLNSCYKGKKVDLILHNGVVHVMNDKMEITEAIAINNGIIVEVGPERQILNKYRSDQIIDAQSKDIFPGFHDSHAHIVDFARQLMYIDLTTARSYYEMVSIIEKDQQITPRKVIIGKGWNSDNWGVTKMLTNRLLNQTFPHIPVAAIRIDGNAMLVNQAMLTYAGITDTTKVINGKIIKDSTGITGMLMGAAMNLVKKQLPPPNPKKLRNKILTVQDKLIAAGITEVHEAGITAEERDVFIHLAEDNLLKINVYAMLLPTPKNIKFAQEKGHYKKNHLSIRSFFLQVDGSLRSHKACLLKPYTDQPGNYGEMLKSKEELEAIAKMARKTNYQLNSQCIGDSAVRVMLHIIDATMANKVDYRWRLENPQIINPKDFQLLRSLGVIPSILPSIAVSNYHWVKDYIGKERLEREGYNYKSLHQNSGMIVMGSGFPVGNYSPFATIYTAVHSRNTEGEPVNGFLPQKFISREVALKAMTLWASYGCFQEKKVGTIQKGKKANLVILDQKAVSTKTYLPNYAWMTIIDGEILFDMR